MNDQNDIKKFIANTKCGRCGQHYEPGNINVVGYLADLLLFIIYCPSCNNIGLAVVNNMGNKETETSADLTETEKSSFSAPIDSSDILDMHSFLKDFKGDFTSLFASYS